MKKTVLWAGNSQAQLAAIDRENAMRILQAIDDYLTDGSGDVKKLRPPRRDLRLQVGDYRVFFLSVGPGAVEILGIQSVLGSGGFNQQEFYATHHLASG